MTHSSPEQDESQSDGDPIKTTAPGHANSLAAKDLWPYFFPYDTPYADQQRAITTTLDATLERGFGVIEAPCGTGKTLASLSAGLAVLRDPRTPIKRIVVLTHLKQQQQAFEADLELINSNLPTDPTPADAIAMAADADHTPGVNQLRPITAVTLVGKADLCPYVASGEIDRGDIYYECSTLRSSVKEIIKKRPDNQRTDAALNLIETGNSPDATLSTQAADNDDAHVIDLKDARHGAAVPDYGGTRVCPYYAQAQLDQMNEIDSLDYEGTILSTAALTKQAVKHGTCPYTAMNKAFPDAEVIVGNYRHAFNPLTVKVMTNAIIDEETLLICDEAHELVPSVREELSLEASYHDLDRAVHQFRRVADTLQEEEQSISGSGDLLKRIKSSPVTTSDLFGIADFIANLQTAMDEYISARLPDVSFPDSSLGDTELPLRPPDEPQPDRLTRWAHSNGVSDRTWELAEEAGNIVADLYREVADDKQSGISPARTVGSLITSWYHCNHEDYFRLISLEKRRADYHAHISPAWRQSHIGKLKLQNCLPAGRIANRLDDFGGGVLMSATLEPLDAFNGTAGIRFLDRPVHQESYEIAFPNENRASVTVNAPPFKYSARGDLTTDTEAMTPVRHTYAAALRDIVTTTPGNVLICMPSYPEAGWAADYLENLRETGVHTKPVRADQSSSNAETDQLKEWFFEERAKVVTTSLRGTLTTGVDFKGERLAAVVVCGVPLLNPGAETQQAKMRAYINRFGGQNGFGYAFVVPAVRKARQALGRVIRSADDVGVRVLIDARYAPSNGNRASDYLSSHEREEFAVTSPADLKGELETFWHAQNH